MRGDLHILKTHKKITDMKNATNRINRFRGLVGVASIAWVLPVSAIENPAFEDAPKEKKGGVAAAEAPKHNKDNKAEKKIEKIALLGLGGTPASETLSLHLGLEDGNGLTVYHIIPGSSAAKVGLEKHDVITELDGQKIGSQDDLREAVIAHQPGDKVIVKYLHKGKAEVKKVTLGDRAEFQALRAPKINPWGQRGGMPEAQHKLMQERMKKHVDQMKLQLEQGGIELELQGLLENAQKAVPPGKQGNRGAGPRIKNFNFGGASITMMDGAGSVTMKTVNGNKDVIVKNKEGEVVFEGPYQTEQDKAAVPDDIRERLERMDFGQGADGGLRLRLAPGGIMPVPVEPEDDAR